MSHDEGPQKLEGGSRATGPVSALFDAVDRLIEKLLGENRPGRRADSDERFEPIDTRNAGGSEKITDENKVGGER